MIKYSSKGSNLSLSASMISLEAALSHSDDRGPASPSVKKRSIKKKVVIGESEEKRRFLPNGSVAPRFVRQLLFFPNSGKINFRSFLSYSAK